MNPAALSDSSRHPIDSIPDDVPCFEELRDVPRDTQVVITVVGPAAAAEEHMGFKRGRPRASATRLTLEVHREVLVRCSAALASQLEPWTPEEPVSKAQRQQQEQAPACNPWVKQEQQQHEEHQHNQHHHPQQQQQQRQDHQGGQQQGSPPYQYKLQLQVPHGQLELGRRLMEGMYRENYNPASLEDPQLVQLAVLAHRYGVSKVLEAVAVPLAIYRPQTIPLDTAAVIYDLPEICRTMEVYQRVYQLAADKLQQDLGDLEVAWHGSYFRAKALVSLPFGALLQLLGDERTQVASEDTAVLTAETWLMHNPDKEGQLPELLAVLRLPQCTASYLISSSISQFLHKMGVTEDEERDLYTMLALPEVESANLQAQYPHIPAWQLPRRPASSVMQLQLSWNLQVTSLQRAFESAQDGPSCHPSVHRRIWHGHGWECGAFVTAKGGFGLYLTCLDGRAFCHVDFAIERQAGSVLPPAAWQLAGQCIQGVHHSYLWADGAEYVTWEQLSSWLVAEQLVQPSGGIRCSLAITKVA